MWNHPREQVKKCGYMQTQHEYEGEIYWNTLRGALSVWQSPSFPNQIAERKVENSPAKPLDRQPSTAQGDLEEPNGLLCLIISMLSSPALSGGLPSSSRGLWATNLLLLGVNMWFRSVKSAKWSSDESISSFWRPEDFLFKPGQFFKPVERYQHFLYSDL